MISKFDPVRKSHAKSTIQKSNTVHYLTQDSPNESIELFGNAISHLDTRTVLRQGCVLRHILFACIDDARNKGTICSRSLENETGKSHTNFLHRWHDSIWIVSELYQIVSETEITLRHNIDCLNNELRIIKIKINTD